MVVQLDLNKHPGQLAHEFIIIETLDTIDNTERLFVLDRQLKSATVTIIIQINLTKTLAITLTLGLTGYSEHLAFHHPAQYLPFLLWRKEGYPEPFPSSTINSQFVMEYLCPQQEWHRWSLIPNTNTKMVLR